MSEIKVIRINKDMLLCTIKHKDRSLWFVSDLNKNISKKINKALQDLSLGYCKYIELKGIGFKAEIDNNTLLLRVGKNISYTIPKDIYCWIVGNKIMGWCCKEEIITNYFQQIIEKTPVRKGTLVRNG